MGWATEVSWFDFCERQWMSLSLFLNLQTASGAHSNSYLVGNVASYLGVK